MFQSNKAKTAGKFIVVMLCFAILFFLLLPFVDNSQPASAAQGKKAVPQIFTSNPLSDLVRKVYALFTRNQKRKAPAVPQVYDYTQQTADASLQQQERFAAQTESADGSGSSASVGASYASYGDAGFINEDGEWVLVRQTTPEAAHRGMHEVNTSDSAYDKLVRLERAAKFTGQPAVIGPQIPDSKWARMWKPIQNFFGFGQENAPAAPKAVSDQNAFALASAASAPNQDRVKRGSSYRRGQSPFLPGSGLAGSSASAAEQAAALSALFNPENALEQYTRSFEDMADGVLSKKEKAAAIEKIKQIGIAQLKKGQQEILDELSQAAQNQQPQNFVEQTVGCSHFQSFYGKTTLCDTPPTQLTQEQLEAQKAEKEKKEAEQAELTSKSAREAVLETARNTGLPPNVLDKLNVVVVLGKTQHIQPDEYDSSDTQEKKQLLNYFLQEKGCFDKTCYWVGGEVQRNGANLRHTMESSGMHFLGDPNKNTQEIALKYQQLLWDKADKYEKQYKALQKQYPEEQRPPEIQEQINELKRKYEALNYTSLSDETYTFPHYIPYTQEEMNQLNARNTPQNLKQNPQDMFITYYPSAAVAQDIKPANPLLAIYDNDQNGMILDQNSPLSNQDRGAYIRVLLEERINKLKDMQEDMAEEMTKEGFGDVLQAIKKQIDKEYKSGLQQP